MMTTKNLAIAISVEERVDDLALLLDLIRHHWKGDFYTVACTTRQELQSPIKSCGIDEVVTTDVELDAVTESGLSRKMLQNIVAVDSLRKSCSRAAASNAPYTLHLRSGAYPLSWARVQQLIEAMQQKGKVFAAGGKGFGFYRHDTPLGQLDDSFFIFENEFAKRKRFWSFQLSDFLPHKISVNGFLALWVLTHVGLRRFWHYFGSKSETFFFDQELNYLRVDSSRIPGDLGARLKAHYLQTTLSSTAPQEFQAMKRRLEEFFQNRGLIEQYNNDDFKRMDQIHSNYSSWSYPRRLFWELRGRGALLKRRFVQEWIFRYRYGDMIWPKRLDEVYQHSLPQSLSSHPDFRDAPFFDTCVT